MNGQPAGTATERVLAGIWSEVLQLAEVGVQDNFFDLGGHSMLMHMVHDRIGELLGENPPIVDLFKYPTIRALASYLDNGSAVDDRPATGPAIESSNGPAVEPSTGRSGLWRLRANRFRTADGRG